MSEPGTPLPWGLSYGFDLGLPATRAVYVAPSNPEAIGIKLCTPWVEGAWDGDPEAEANARYIVKACNLYPELLAALEDFVARVDAGEVRSKRTYAAFKALIAKARAA